MALTPLFKQQNQAQWTVIIGSPLTVLEVEIHGGYLHVIEISHRRIDQST